MHNIAQLALLLVRQSINNRVLFLWDFNEYDCLDVDILYMYLLANQSLWRKLTYVVQIIAIACLHAWLQQDVSKPCMPPSLPAYPLVKDKTKQSKERNTIILVMQ